MTPTLRQEGQLRLETLGHLSDNYSDVASASNTGSGDLDDESFWDADSSSSRASTVAVDFQKPPPPGVEMRPSSRMSWHSSMSGFGQGGVVPEPFQSSSFDMSHLRPAKGLPQSRHPSILRPGAGHRCTVSDYSVDELLGMPSDINHDLEMLYRPQSSYTGTQNPTKRPGMIPRSKSDFGTQATQSWRRPYNIQHADSIAETSPTDVQHPATRPVMQPRSSSDHGSDKTVRRNKNAHADSNAENSHTAVRHLTTRPAMRSRSRSDYGSDETHSWHRSSSDLYIGRAMSICGDEPALNCTNYSYSRPASRADTSSGPVLAYSAYEPPPPYSIYQPPPPVSTYLAYQPPAAKPSDDSVRASASLYPTPPCNSYVDNTILDDDEKDDDARSHHSVATCSHAPRSRRNSAQPMRSQQRSSQFPAYLDFEIVAPPVARAETPAPVLIRIPTPTPAPMASFADHSRPSSTHLQVRPPAVRTTSNYSRKLSSDSVHTLTGSSRPTSSSSSCVPNSAYGAWESDHPRQKPASFRDRAQESFERNIHEQMVKAGRRPLPSFKVNQVDKSPNSAPTMIKQSPTSPPFTMKKPKASRRERGGPKAKQMGSRLERPRQKSRRESWEISSEDESEFEKYMSDAAKLFQSSRASVKHASASASAPMTRRGTPELKHGPFFENGQVPTVDTRVGPEMETGSVAFNPGWSGEGNGPSPFTNGRRNSGIRDDDLSGPGQGRSDRSHAANYSFLSSEYTQPRTAVDPESYQSAEQRQRPQQQQQQQQNPSSTQSRPAQRPRAKSFTSTYHNEQTEVGIHRTYTLSREQLGFAALPSPFEDLRRPFPYDPQQAPLDDRNCLPSHDVHRKRRASHQLELQNVHPERTLSRKKGMILR